MSKLKGFLRLGRGYSEALLHIVIVTVAQLLTCQKSMCLFHISLAFRKVSLGLCISYPLDPPSQPMGKAGRLSQILLMKKQCLMDEFIKLEVPLKRKRAQLIHLYDKVFLYAITYACHLLHSPVINLTLKCQTLCRWWGRRKAPFFSMMSTQRTPGSIIGTRNKQTAMVEGD